MLNLFKPYMGVSVFKILNGTMIMEYISKRLIDFIESTLYLFYKPI